jgi:hypothetical protein
MNALCMVTFYNRVKKEQGLKIARNFEEVPEGMKSFSINKRNSIFHSFTNLAGK